MSVTPTSSGYPGGSGRSQVVAAQSRTIRLEEDPALGAVQLALAVASGRAKIPAYRPNL